ncbi:N-formylglutamate amidohydrolase [Sedimentitalea arenosa]|jgi:N-formylglutamate deformylase|uniref:N-formylglutamate amidohydrolase n=1 Tax=Sedimentitalea arenosa TaxID=2798803 RepID=A0A8J7ILN5_9RHOB|nr:N-formylglutamate amidohydrolase [Arenibacterium arenosum]MBJ6372783.1 N-formylglutamate amidohydrolase [Arenibacterium arenosum]
MSKPVFHLMRPDQLMSSVVFASPHSGCDYPEAFVRDSLLDGQAIRSSEDAFVDLLFDGAPEFGAPLLAARAPRAYVDLNRSPDELDPALIRGARRIGQNPRVASGLGVIPRVVANGRAIYAGKLPMIEAERRLKETWYPYHEALQSLLNAAHAQFGEAILIDCHSMPHEAMDGVARSRGQSPEIVLGDRFGAAASGEIVDRIEAAFAGAGLVVARNAPFAGAYVTQAYGRPSRRQHAIQVEIDRAIYMDEKRIEPNAGFDPLRALLRKVTAEIVSIGFEQMPLAAE